MYENQKRWSLTVNLLYHVFHIQNLQKTMLQFPDKIIISDRSLFSGHAFCYADTQSGILHPIENILYKKISHIAASTVPKPHGFIYIRTQPEISFERICKRKRKEEAHIDAEYWKKLHEGHEHMFFHDNSITKNIPLLILEYNDNMHEKETCIAQAIQKITSFIQQCIEKNNHIPTNQREFNVYP
jgi:deoxyadenosine/deoxycytidine kinase